MKGWKHKKTSTIIGTEKTPTKMEAGQVIINKKATKKHLDKLIDINNDGLDKTSTKVSTDGTDGGILKGKPHYDENGNPTGGIPVIVDGGKKIEVEGDEFVVNKEASQKHWKELSRINQSAGNGVPINPSDVGSDEDPEEFRKGGVIEFNPNHLPNHLIYSYAKKVKEKYPKVWDMGGNIFGNEAFKNLERVSKRGYWTENEEWMYIKWRSYVARHHKDFRIAGTIAMLKWVDKTDKGWPYMKALIEKEIAKKYPKKGWKNKMAEGGGVVTYKNKYNKKYSYDKDESHDLKEIAKDTGVSEKGLQQIYNKGVGAYKTNPQSVRLNVKSKEQWAMARVYSAVMGGKAARVDAKELKMQYGGNTVNNACIEELVSLINSHSEIEYWDVDKNTENLVIVFKNEIGNYDIDIYNQFLNGLAECETVFDKEVEIQYDNSDYKTIFVKLKTSIENGGGKNIEFMKWFVDWYKTINKQININFSVPNILSPFKEDNVIILDLFEKINQDIDAKPYLNKIIEKADDFGVVIYLEPTPRYKYFLENAEKRKKISKDYLIKYYKNFGFELTSNGQFMKRVPKMKNGGIIKDITCTQCGWSWNKSDSEKHDEYVCHKCGTDNEMKDGGELAKGIKAEKEHIDTAKKLYSHKLTPNEAARSIAMEHIKEDPKYYSKMENIDFDNHYNEIKSKYADGGSVEPTYTLRTPTGEKSKLTYLQQVLVRTSSFKKFFGDWETAAKMYLADNKENYKKHFENVSKVMDMSVLEPRVVYHGTRTEEQFFMFDVSKEKGQGRPYAYFAYNKEYSQNFTEFSQRNHSNSNPFLYECFLNIRKPFMALGHAYEMRKRNVEYWINAMVGTIALDKYNTIEKNAKTKKLEDAVISQIEKYLIDSAGNTDVSFWSFMARDTNADFKYFLISYGYDGIFYGEEYSTSYDPENPKEYTNAVTVFTANDIKLADGKNLNFDPMSADIRYENGGVPEKQAEMEVSPIEQSLSKKERLGNLLFGQKYAKGGAVNTEKQEIIHREKETNNNRKFVDELIKKMKQ